LLDGLGLLEDGALEREFHLPPLAVGGRGARRRRRPDGGIRRDPQELGCLVVESHGPEGRDRLPHVSGRDRLGFVAHGAGQGARQGVRQERPNARGVTRNQGFAEGPEEGEHGASGVLCY
jgi:hypothetical protein